jgi:drug/metabolite transporter (DMT)-like permease
VLLAVRDGVPQLAPLYLGLVGLLGLAVFGALVAHGSPASVRRIVPLAWLFAIVALIGITVGTLYQKRFGGGIDWRPALSVQYASAGVMFMVAALAFETRVVHWTPQFLFALGWLVLVLSFGAIWLLYFLIRRAAATRVVSLFYLTPPVTALMAWLLFDERLAPLALLGMAICVVGVFLVNWRLGGAKA